MSAYGLKILATGSARPSRIVHNDDLAKIVDTSDEWIFPRTGIRTRYFCAEGETATTLGIEAARRALRASGLAPEDIDCLVCGTTSGEYACPSLACLIQRDLGIREDVPAVDVNAACTGFIYALETARGMMTGMKLDQDAQDGREGGCAGQNPSGNRKYRALVVGAEHLSKYLDMTDRTTCVLFGDGAGAAVVELTQGLPYAGMLGARGGMEICVEGPGAEPSRLKMDGTAVFRFATEALCRCVNVLLEKSGMRLDQVDQVICHQANARIIDFCVRKLKAPQEKFFENMDHYGNTGAASVALALDEAVEKGIVTSGQTIMLVGFGGGLTWAGTLLQMA